MGIYNGLVVAANRFKNAFAQIDVQLKRRYELIPNLVEAVKGYMGHERETLDAVIRARNSAMAVEQKVAANPSDAAAMLALLAWEGQPESDQAARAFDTGMRGYIGSDHSHRLPPREECSLAAFDAALQTLNQSVPAIKRRIVVACAACILANQQVTVREAELLRAICDTLDCPLPPLVVGEAEGR